MDNFLNFMKRPFDHIDANIFLFWLGIVVALTFIIVFFGVTGTKRKIKKSRRVIDAMAEKLNRQEKAIEVQKVMLDTLADKLNESNERLSIIMRNTSTETMNRLFDSNEKDLEALIYASFTTKDEKNKAQLFDKLGGLFTNATLDPDKLERAINDYGLSKTEDDLNRR